MKKIFLLISIFVCVILMDIITKRLALYYLYEGQSINIIDNLFNIVLYKNPGAAFSILSDFSNVGLKLLFFYSVTAIASLVLIYLIIKDYSKNISTVGYLLILSGAIGNLIDRVLFGKVIDFIQVHLGDIYYYPAFNVADSAISIGVGLIILEFAIDFFKSKKINQKSSGKSS